jgi:ribokinase
MLPKIVVFGSLNMDFVVKVPRLPAPGETALGSDFQMIPGGKGANQACAVGRVGQGAVQGSMVGRVGYDLFADHLKASLSAAGVDVSFVHATKSAPTGVALIWVEAHGQNSIVVASGANHSFDAAEIEAFRPAFAGASYALFQLESPLSVVESALKLARESGAKTILDPAPAHTLSSDILAHVDILTPNESEACLLLGRDSKRIASADVSEIARQLLALGCGAVVLKLGDAGCFYCDHTVELALPAFAVDAIDATAAGDVFNASLAVALAENRTIEESLRFASAAAALSVSKMGAQSSVPTRGEVTSLLFESLDHQ